MVENRVFRKVSLERLSSPEQLDLLMKVIQPQSWLALLGIGCLLLVAMIWAVAGSIPVEVNAPAILLPTGGIRSIISLHTGQITELDIASGDLVEAGQVIGEVTPLGQSTGEPLISPFGGRILELKTGNGHILSPGTPIASLEPAGAEQTLEAVMYVPRSAAQQLEPDMVVKLALESVQVNEYGYLLGRILSVGDFPMSNQGIVSRVGSEELAAIFNGKDSPIEIHIALLEEVNTPSGFKWTTSTGPDYTIGSGSLASAKVVVDQQRPLNLFLTQ